MLDHRIGGCHRCPRPFSAFSADLTRYRCACMTPPPRTDTARRTRSTAAHAHPVSGAQRSPGGAEPFAPVGCCRAGCGHVRQPASARGRSSPRAALPRTSAAPTQHRATHRRPAHRRPATRAVRPFARPASRRGRGRARVGTGSAREHGRRPRGRRAGPRFAAPAGAVAAPGSPQAGRAPALLRRPGRGAAPPSSSRRPACRTGRSHARPGRGAARARPGTRASPGLR